jgi:hypothetical protein
MPQLKINSGDEENPGSACQEQEDEEIIVYDVEEEIEIVEKEIEERSAVKDIPQDEDEVATLELMEKIAVSGKCGCLSTT